MVHSIEKMEPKEAIDNLIYTISKWNMSSTSSGGVISYATTIPSSEEEWIGDNGLKYFKEVISEDLEGWSGNMTKHKISKQTLIFLKEKTNNEGYIGAKTCK